MATVIDAIVSVLRKAFEVLQEGWKNLTSNDKAVLVIASAVELFALLFCGGIIFEGAVFALSMMVSLALLIVTVPPVLKFLAKYRVAVDITVTAFLLVFGFITGSVTLATSLMFFGLCLSAGLRLAKAVDHMIPETNVNLRSIFGLKKA